MPGSRPNTGTGLALRWVKGMSKTRINGIIFGGIQKFSLSDYPGRPALVLFTRGCNLRCSWCHNPGLVDPKQYLPAFSEEEVLAFLHHRQGCLPAVVVSGGEPTLHSGLLSLLGHIKRLGYLVKLDSNGTNPAILQEALAQNLLDCLAVDYKLLPNDYAGLLPASQQNDEKIRRKVIASIMESIRVTLADPRGYLRTTVIPEIHRPHNDKDTYLEKMGQCLRELGFDAYPDTPKWRLQKAVAAKAGVGLRAKK